MATTPNIEIILATVSQTLGPEWAEIINAAFEKLDEHDHSTGKGKKITPAGLDITSALDFQNQDLQNAMSLGMQGQASANPAKPSSLQSVGSNLFYVNSAGASVQITSGSGVVSSGSGKLTVSEPASYPYSVVLADSEKVLLVDTTAARTINLPSAANVIYVILKDVSGEAQNNNITVVADGSDTIDGTTDDYTINTNNGSFGFISDGVSRWFVV